jgi:plasmid stability protein
MSSMMVQIRNVPVELHRRLKARAAVEGLSGLTSRVLLVAAKSKKP